MKPLELITAIEKTLSAQEVWRWEAVEESLLDEMFVQFKRLVGEGSRLLVDLDALDKSERMSEEQAEWEGDMRQAEDDGRMT